MLQTIQLRGTESKLYKLVAPLVMDPSVLRKNNNYPFKTAENYVWFVAVIGKRVVGFIPVELRGKTAIINNYYVDENEEAALPLLISAVASALGAERKLSSVTLTEHRSVFEEQGFVIEKEWKRYVKMRKE